MKMKLVSWIAASLLMAAPIFIGCSDDDGGSSIDNVKACNDWLESISCGSTDFSTMVDCSVYDGYNCDVADYFTCLTENTTCDETTGIPDIAGWAGCADKAQCD